MQGSNYTGVKKNINNECQEVVLIFLLVRILTELQQFDRELLRHLLDSELGIGLFDYMDNDIMSMPVQQQQKNFKIVGH